MFLDTKKYEILKKGCLFILFGILCMSIFASNDKNNKEYVKNVSFPIEIPRDNTPILLTPVSDNAVRVQIKGESDHQLEEIIYVDSEYNYDGEYILNKDEAILRLPKLTVSYDRTSDVLTFKDIDGNVILKELSEGRLLETSKIQGETTTISSQSFYSPEDEAIFGTGQFQDGYLNIKGLPRRLTQVNTQISVPFIISNYGYGFLWNNYGLTEFNPCSNILKLEPSQDKKEEIIVDVTTTNGNVKETRNINIFEGIIELPESGNYRFLLDVGQRMARKQKIVIDDSVYIDVNNLWLPPTTSFISNFGKGSHKIIYEGEKNDKPTISWEKVENKTQWQSPVSSGIDYTVFSGNPDQVIAAYRKVTGNSPMLPIWAFGYTHCRERYNTQEELLENAKEFRKRQIPIDIIVQDWQYWGKYGWNAMRFDEDKYPDPTAMIDSLHKDNIKIMLSVWAKIDSKSELGEIAQEKGYYIPNTDWIDFFNPEAASFYWKNSSNRLLKAHGIDAWWQDATEPENDDLKDRRIANGTLPGEVYRNAFPSFVNKTVYNGLRTDNPEKRILILTRSGFPGIQRFAVSTWSGDVGYDLSTLRRQIIGGLGQMSSGLPWWTFDAGGFFRPKDQYENENYHDILIRWVQCATFLPMMRIHGYISNTEPWRYGEKVDSIIHKYINLRYELLPYTYSCASKVSREGYTLMRPLIMDFNNDKDALKQSCQFMFGNSILVSPVTENPGEITRTYLPAGCNWIDYWTKEEFSGGQYIDKNVEIEKIPLYIKAGAIIPFSKSKQYSNDNTDSSMYIYVYTGADGEFDLYEDDGDTYKYEKGEFSIIPFKWDDNNKILLIGKRKGDFEGMLENRTFKVSTHKGDVVKVNYTGEPLTIKLN